MNIFTTEEHCGVCDSLINIGQFRCELQQTIVCDRCRQHYFDNIGYYLKELACYRSLVLSGNLDADMRPPQFPTLKPQF